MVKLAVMAEVKTHFRPEFINRIDEIVVFHALDEKNIGAIAKIQLQRLQEPAGEDGDAARCVGRGAGKIGKPGFDPVYGARPLKRAIQQQIENPVAKLILAGRFGRRM